MLKKLSLAQTPTPLQRMDRVSDSLGIELWIKRDDLTGDILTGGNKIRKLEYILEDAKSKGADSIIVCGGSQSNLVKTAAALAIKLGIKPVLALLGRKPDLKKGNLFFDTLLNVEVHFVDGNHPSSLDETVANLKKVLEAQGRCVYIVPLGASNGLGAIGYIDAYQEMQGQAESLGISFDWEFVSAGSGGTFAGIYMGHGMSAAKSRLVGVSPWLEAGEVKKRISGCIDEAARLLNTNIEMKEMVVEESFIGEGYGIPTRACIEAIGILARKEGILLDQTYTGKAMACLIDYVRNGNVKPGQRVLFWHTGGAPALTLLEEQWDALNKSVD